MESVSMPLTHSRYAERFISHRVPVVKRVPNKATRKRQTNPSMLVLFKEKRT